MHRRPPLSTLFPYTTLFRSADLDVVTYIPEHFLIEDLQAVDVLASGDDLHAGFFAAVVLADGGAGMIRLEGVLDAQLYAGAAQGAGGAGVDGFHPEVGQLVGHIVVGAAYGHHLVHPDLIRVGTGEMVLLVDDGLSRAGAGSDLGEGDLAVAAVEGLHLAFAAVGVAGADHQLPGKVDTGEAVADHVAEVLGLLQVPAGQVDQTGIDTGLLERQHGIEGAVRLAQGGEHLAYLEQVLVDRKSVV